MHESLKVIESSCCSCATFIPTVAFFYFFPDIYAKTGPAAPIMDSVLPEALPKMDEQSRKNMPKWS